MKTSDIVPISRRALERLFKLRGIGEEGHDGERRRAPRWPFPGTVELWIPQEDGSEEYRLASCENISEGGAGMRCDDAYDSGTELAIAVHQPELSLHGRARVCHCTPLQNEYYVGLEFIFERAS